MGIRFLGDPDRNQGPEIEALRLAEAAGMTLESGPRGLELRVEGERPGQGVRGEVEETLERRLDAGHPLRRIVSGLGEIPGAVLDATGGLGGDAAIAAASTTRRVVVCERHPVLAALLVDGRDRALRAGHEPAGRMEIHPEDSRAYLEHAEVPPALVMIDPMFPPRRRASALPPKPMQRLRALLEGAEETVSAEVERLLAAADRAGASRIVLKRPPDAPAPESPLGAPTFEISTKLLRWSVWERRRGPRDEDASGVHDGDM